MVLVSKETEPSYEMVERPSVPVFVVMRMTPFAALTPYMAAVAASFNMDMDAMSFGLRYCICLSTPSTRMRGEDPLKVERPLTSSWAESSPGVPVFCTVVRPDSLPASMFCTLACGAFRSSLLETCDTEPTTNCRFCIPYPTTSTSSRTVDSSSSRTLTTERPATGTSSVL